MIQAKRYKALVRGEKHMTSKKVISEELDFLDLSVGTGIESTIENMSAVGAVEIVDIISGDFVADSSGQSGKVGFIVQGDGRTFQEGANTVIKLCKSFEQINPKTKLCAPKVSKDAKSKIAQSTEHFQALKNALSNQSKKANKAKSGEAS